MTKTTDIRNLRMAKPHGTNGWVRKSSILCHANADPKRTRSLPRDQDLAGIAITCQTGDVNPAHVFICGNLALDFAATLRGRRSTRSETLLTPARLAAWYLESGIVDELSPGAAPDLVQAKAAREAMYVLVIAQLQRKNYDPTALDLLNQTAREPAAVPQLTASGRHTEATPAEALSTLAREAVELLSGSETALLKECENPECTTVYLDRSRGGRRQWCSMDPCGNKIKAAAYRARKRVAST